eukprot:TRINITY_DN4261_c0_g1_i1.p1 TRINITY_DN4261_c0_g1~~TRINITY_DN4261_c0_g1_i1.p1  ORF type:complete len:610 (+),score=197.94 TRINITY_DN4261_c0_g1_i1:239-2068(+)
MASIDPQDLTDFELLSEDGKFGTVYSARCKGQIVAVKCITLDEGSDCNSIVEKFKNEVEIISKAQSPHIVQFLGVCVNDNNLQIVMEKLEGSLEHKLLNKQFSNIVVRLTMALGIAKGMAWIHPQVVHRDLKLGNILLGKGNIVKICDFGLSEIKPDLWLQDTSYAKGSPLYMSPEVLTGQPFDEKADVYSYGIMLWEFLTQEEAYGGEYDHLTVLEFRDEVVHNEARPKISSNFQKRYGDFIDLMKQCWATDPNERPSFQEIVVRLQDIIIDIAIEDPYGRYLWKNCFRESQAVSWEIFYENFMQLLLDVGLEKEGEIHLNNNVTSEELIEILKTATDYQLDMLHNNIQLEKFVENELFRRYGVKEMPIQGTEEINKECLRAIFSKPSATEGDPDEVTMIHFGRMLTFFGPIKEDNDQVCILDRIRVLLSSQWFHGDLSVKEAESRLHGTNGKASFLVRLSNSSKYCFTVSRIKNNGTYIHTRVEYKQSIFDKTGGKRSGFICNGRAFPTLGAYIEFNNRNVWPNRPFVPCSGSKYMSIFNDPYNNRQYVIEDEYNIDNINFNGNNNDNLNFNDFPMDFNNSANINMIQINDELFDQEIQNFHINLED